MGFVREETRGGGRTVVKVRYSADKRIADRVTFAGQFGGFDAAAVERVKAKQFGVQTLDGEVVSFTPEEAIDFLNKRSRNIEMNNAALEALRMAKVEARAIEESERETTRKKESGGLEKMKHERLTEYLDEVKKIYAEERNRYLKLHEKLNKAEAVFAAAVGAEKNGKITAAQGMLAKADHIEAQERFKNELNDLRKNHAAALADVRAEMQKDIDARYALDGGTIDEDTMKLLNAGIMSASELGKAAETASPTMRRIIAKHAANLADTAKNKAEATEARILASKLAHDDKGARALDLFDNLADWTDRALSMGEEIAENGGAKPRADSPVYADAFAKRFDETFETLTAQLAELDE